MKFWRLLYQIGLNVSALILPVVALFSKRVRRWWKHARPIPPVPPEGKPVLWMHCASAGEFEQGRVVLEFLLRQLPVRPFFVLTFFSPSGWERYQHNYSYADWVGPAPMDFPWLIRRWVHTLQPVAVFFVKYDLWPNLLHILRQMGIPTYLLSAHIVPLQGLRWWWKKQLLPYLQWIFVQTQEDGQRLTHIGVTQFSVAGDTRLLRVMEIAKQPKSFPDIERWIGGRFCVVAGSLWPADVDFLAEAYGMLRGYETYWLLVPHHVSEEMIVYIHRKWPVRCVQYSQDYQGVRRNTLIIDTMGILAYLYAYADVVWIGGGFGKGIHNILEAIIYKKPVFFGPNYQSFPEAHEMIKRGVAESCRYPVSFANAVKSLHKDRRRAQVIFSKVDSYLSAQGDILHIIWDKLQREEWVQRLKRQAVSLNDSPEPSTLTF
ncbi:MAG: glycosyltransferase N-terminal domain-containing protein [Bacteroidia bacterium]|nr:glycosyltransferase N-terminal domain-containing protein [Bacteroidia bacterium]